MERLALLTLLVLAPHTKVPGVEIVYPFRPVDLVILAASLTYLRWTRQPPRLFTAVPEMLLCFFVSIASAFWGHYLLDSLRLERLIDGGALVSYLPFAVKKLLLMAICFLGFQFVTSSRAIDNRQLLHGWYRGLVISVALHLLCYAVSSNFLMQRAGVFVEGNHGGSFYLLSFFLMWWGKQRGMRIGGNGMRLALLGILLTRSTTALILLMPLGAIAFLMTPAPAGRRGPRSGAIVLALVGSMLIAAVFGAEIMTKLTGQDIDPSSFSRYDRISSIVSGMDMFLAHPIFGVGIQGYAFALPEYVDAFIDNFFDWNSRRIANNIYVELLAEQGVIGMGAMLVVLSRIARPATRTARANATLFAGMLSILLSWLAFPTYTISFHWIGLALIHRLAVQGLAPYPIAKSDRPAIALPSGQVDSPSSHSSAQPSAS